MPLVPPTVSVTVIVVELLTATEAAEISTPEVKVMFGSGTEVSNSKPPGTFNTRVRFAPELKSDLFPSRMTIGPRAVQAGEIALAALSARMLVPPVALVIVTVAYAPVPSKEAPTTISRKSQDIRAMARVRASLAPRRNRGSASRPTKPKPIFFAEKSLTLCD